MNYGIVKRGTSHTSTGISRNVKQAKRNERIMMNAGRVRPRMLTLGRKTGYRHLKRSHGTAQVDVLPNTSHARIKCRPDASSVRRSRASRLSPLIIRALAGLEHSFVGGGDQRRSQLHEVAIAAVTPFDEPRRILRPPHDHASSQRFVGGDPDDDIRDLIRREQT